MKWYELRELENQESVVIPEGVKVIPDYAFAASDVLRRVELPSSLIHIGKGAFKGCRLLEDVRFSDRGALRSIGAQAFAKCGLEQIRLPEGVTSIGERAFFCCRDLEWISIPPTVKHMRDRAFAGCDNLYAMDLPDEVPLGDQCFFRCDHLTDKNGFFIRNGVAEYCSSRGAETLIIPEGVIEIGCHLLCPPGNFSRIVFPSTLKKIRHDAFSGINIHEIEFAKGGRPFSIEDRAFYLCELSSLLLPDTLRYVGEEAFASNSHLQTLFITGNKKIGRRAFDDTKLKTLFLSDSGKICLEANSFTDCKELTHIAIVPSVWDALPEAIRMRFLVSKWTLRCFHQNDISEEWHRRIRWGVNFNTEFREAMAAALAFNDERDGLQTLLEMLDAPLRRECISECIELCISPDVKLLLLEESNKNAKEDHGDER